MFLKINYKTIRGRLQSTNFCISVVRDFYDYQCLAHRQGVRDGGGQHCGERPPQPPTPGPDDSLQQACGQPIG